MRLEQQAVAHLVDGDVQPAQMEPLLFDAVSKRFDRGRSSSVVFDRHRFCWAVQPPSFEDWLAFCVGTGRLSVETGCLCVGTGRLSVETGPLSVQTGVCPPVACGFWLISLWSPVLSLSCLYQSWIPRACL